MKKLSAGILLALFATFIWNPALADETEFDNLLSYGNNLPGWKFGRGLTNVLLGPHELFATMTNSAIAGSYDGAYRAGFHGSIAGSLNGYIAGSGLGLKRMVKRMTMGCLEMLTFWRPEYGPTTKHPYGTRSMVFGHQDYFDQDPFWYNGPSR